MNISSRFNRFYHAILGEAYKNTEAIQFWEWVDFRTGRPPLTFIKDTDYDCVACEKGTPLERDNSLKTIFKNMNLDYDIDGDGKVSTTEIENSRLCRHIEWITKILNENGVQFKHDIEEWERLKRDAGIL